MSKAEREQLRAISKIISGWSDTARRVLTDRTSVQSAADDATRQLTSRAVTVSRDGSPAWRVIPLSVFGDLDLARRLAYRANLRALRQEDEAMVAHLTNDAPRALADVSGILSARRFINGRAKREAGERAGMHLRAIHHWGISQGIPARLTHLAQPTGVVDPGSTMLADLLGERLGFRPALQRLGTDPSLIALDGAIVTRLPAAVRTIAAAVAGETSARNAVKAAGDEIRRVETRRLLDEMPLDRLKETTKDRLIIAPLLDAGLESVHDVIDREWEIKHLSGVGEITARRVVGAAMSLWQTTFDEMPVRIDIAKRGPENTQLLSRLAAWDATRRTKGAVSDLARSAELTPLAERLGHSTTHLLMLKTGSIDSSTLLESIETVLRRAELIDSYDPAKAQQRPDDVWQDFLSRPADYFAMLAELGFLTEDAAKAHGDLPEEIIEAIRAQDLRTEYLQASLRGYQSFAARFALVQRKVIIGDEMGLGKTVEALAVLAHLRSKGSHHFLVVCPASVVTNWTREVAAKTKLAAHRLHGLDRAYALRSWQRTGGVAVTTFDTLGWFEENWSWPGGDLSCVVVDEAHYIKNPTTLRSRRTSAILERCELAILLTGTPLENRVDDFSNLAAYVRPDLAERSRDLTARKFRKHIAPAYLRRNQEDVLTELPELVEVEEWLPMSVPDLSLYRQAVADGTFPAMRQAAMLAGEKSEKLQRLVEIVEEAAKNGRKVIVYSYFLEVLSLVMRSLSTQAIGPLTGSVPAPRRQEMVDRFTGAPDGTVLVAQIVAGGVGLNIQAASVIVMCEPQLKPTTEAQAIARAHRMGQVQTVQVHRLLSEDSVDERIVEILATKRQLFDEYARVSTMAESTPEAVDVSDAEMARMVVAAERERLFSGATPSADD